MDENEITNILLPSTSTSNGFIIKNEVLQPNLSKEDAQFCIVKQEDFYTEPYELQFKSIKPEVKVEIEDNEDDISIKFEPLICEDLHIKDENEPIDQSIETNTESEYYYCNRKFSDKNSLEQNLNFKQHTKTRTEEKLFKCTHCDYRAVRKGFLQTHMRTHTGEKPFNCDICDYKAAHITSLKQHVQTHTGEKPFNCNICNFKTSCQSNLKKHVRTHTGEKPFKCATCGFRSARKVSLKTHIMKNHTGEKPFNCNFCDFKTVHPNNLKHHVKIHSGEKPFECNICDYKSISMSNLKRHVKIHKGN